MRDLDKLERRFVKPPLKHLVALKIAVGFLDHDLALEQQTLEHLADVERGKVRVVRAQRDVFQSRNTAIVASDSCALIRL